MSSAAWWPVAVVLTLCARGAETAATAPFKDDASLRPDATGTKLVASPNATTGICTKLLVESQCGRAPGVTLVHVNKAGGTSMACMIKKCDSKRLARIEHPRVGGNVFHSTVREYYENLKKWDPSKVFYFASVRNPYDRMVSFFYYRVAECAKSKGKAGERCDDHSINPNCVDDCDERHVPQLEHLSKAKPGEQIKAFQDWLEFMDGNHPEDTDDSFVLSGLNREPRCDPSAASWLEAPDEKQAVSFWFDSSMIDELMPQVMSQCLPECKKDMSSKCLGGSQRNTNDIDKPEAAMHFQGKRGRVAAAIIERRLKKDFDVLGYQKGVWTGPPPSGCGGMAVSEGKRHLRSTCGSFELRAVE